MTKAPPTARQLAYLRALAIRTGQTFTPPTSSRDASRQIHRLRSVTPTGRVELAIERSDLAAERAARERNCDVPIHLDAETTGWGAGATWKGRP